MFGLGCVLNSELMEFLNEVGMRWARRSRDNCDSKIWSQSNWKNHRPPTEVHIQEFIADSDCQMTCLFCF